ncbi:hypothetical protein EAI30_10580 [Romboutsia ilealis]|nr:hypothetical protein [Romboutsia ilealis]
MNKEVFFEYYFRFLTLFFWPIIFYKIIFIQNYTLETILFYSYTFVGIIYIALLIFYFMGMKKLRNINLHYRINTICSYILTLSTFLLFPTNLTLLYLKFIFILIYFYFSCRMVFRFKNEEGVVGIISSLLLMVIAIWY